MTKAIARPPGAKTNGSRRSWPVSGRTGARRAALLAVAGLVLLPAAGSASSGGLGTPGGSTSTTAPVPAPAASTFGTRVLRPGMQGDDVRILNGIVASKPYAPSVRLTDVFESPTASAVRQFQAREGIAASGVVNTTTAQQLTGSMRLGEASWYGPGLYGNNTACGQVLGPGTIGVANKSLPCGTKVTFAYHGHYVVARVIDRGPYSAGRTWDLTKATSDALGVTAAGVANVRYAVDR